MSGKLFLQIIILIVIGAVVMSATKIGMRCAKYKYFGKGAAKVCAHRPAEVQK